MTEQSQKNSVERMDIVIVGHVDHGKSTIIGRLLADTNSLPSGKLEQVRETCRRNSKPFEYAFLLDALKDERSQGITIDSARVFFKTSKRRYIIIDAPGHIEFLKNMVTGASHAEAALLVIDANEGVQENSRRHGYLLSMLGIRRLTVLVSKMDLVGYKKEVFDSIKSEYSEFLRQIQLDGPFIPVSGMAGDNIAAASQNMGWYSGPTVLQTLDRFEKEPLPVDKPLRLPIQDVYKFTAFGDKRRIIAGTVETGQVSLGDELIFYPSGKTGRVKTLEKFNAPPSDTFGAGSAASLTLDKQIYISRGQLACKTGQTPPELSSRMQVSLFWMGKNPLLKNKEYILKLGTARQPMLVEEILGVIDAAELTISKSPERVECHQVAQCILRTNRAVAFDPADRIAAAGRFVIVDDFEIRGGGIITQALPDPQETMRNYVMTRNLKWATSTISREQRQERYKQKAALILVTGRRNVGKKTLARAIEQRLFADGRMVFFMGIANVLYGVDADIKKPGPDQSHRPEHLRRLGEVANLLLEAGFILIVTAISLSAEDLKIVTNVVDSDLIEVVWLGDDPTDIKISLHAPSLDNLDGTIDNVQSLLQNRGIIFNR
jgi:bifunctional enzyme CysN/CysC